MHAQKGGGWGAAGNLLHRGGKNKKKKREREGGYRVRFLKEVLFGPPFSA